MAQRNKKTEKLLREQQERMVRYDRKTLAYALARARGLDKDYKALDFFVNSCADGIIPIDKDSVKKELTEIWNKNRHLCHAGCKEHFMTYGHFTYSNYREDGNVCIICGNPLLCGGEKRAHTYQEISQVECRNREIYHGGNCYHVSVCSNCGDVRAVDSSD